MIVVCLLGLFELFKSCYSNVLLNMHSLELYIQTMRASTTIIEQDSYLFQVSCTNFF